jgi:hypothetical protein
VVVVLILVDLESNILQGAKLWNALDMFGQFGQCVLGPLKLLQFGPVVAAAKVPVMYPMQSPEQRNSRTVKGVVLIIRPVSAEAIPKYSLKCWGIVGWFRSV